MKSTRAAADVAAASTLSPNGKQLSPNGKTWG